MISGDSIREMIALKLAHLSSPYTPPASPLSPRPLATPLPQYRGLQGGKQMGDHYLEGCFVVSSGLCVLRCPCVIGVGRLE